MDVSREDITTCSKCKTILLKKSGSSFPPFLDLDNGVKNK
jgi:hypothetical protein